MQQDNIEEPEPLGFRADFVERLDQFFRGNGSGPARTTGGLSVGATAKQLLAQEEQLGRELDQAMDSVLDGDLSPVPPRNRGFSFEELQEALDGSEKTYPIVKPKSKYERLFVAVRKLEDELESAGPDELPALTAELAKVRNAWAQEFVRSFGERARRIHLINVWRGDEGQGEYNRSRRRKNAPNACLADLTPEQRLIHRRAQKADSKWRADKVKAGWTVKRIEDGLEQRRAKRSAVAS
ncbi:hypothetical protein [Sulfitobacter geojensis]|uniref:Uncharacterized protein n=1 Tax=Sulfitobacter geojensis TaxID=1342299 RepID=A0AAE2VWQ4_9RHOB|nr:hypothetical protein [Sulfitobacter geojensis]MBM1688823.1 hypothetical protein [Sulfitobacter geojensis]MBM1692890.1 hypothetical protein [Sulfitobacter geojensis]MBM1705056.1 hypothetical protein [Sulfitobacter geojensis]MBM1709114.1 hypothetical protein [Sulfitobacter geojensis]MBM1713179.1 hypothetical protein [Sulfitobacter geojensis]